MCSFQLSLFPEDTPSNDISKLEIEVKEEVIQDKAVLLEDLKNTCLSCTKCELAKGRTQVVFSSGKRESLIMIIGEGPGENEDKTGIPFVGKAGQLLDKVLESVGLNREEDVYIANVVKCRPPNNRTPLNEEVEACFPYLEKQIELSESRIILLTGATALKAILKNNSSISRVRGHWFELGNKWVMPIFHPSYLLRNPEKEVGSPKWLTWQDIKKVKQKYDEIRGLIL